jgi:hypothetical protein
MIVGAVRQEGEYSWQDACDAWAAQDGGTEAGVHQMRVSEVETGLGEGDECKEVSEANPGDEQFEAEGLLIEGEEREYVLELLMQEAPPKLCASMHPAGAELATLKGKRKRNLGKKLRKRLKMARGMATKDSRKERKVDAAGGRKGQVTVDLSRNPKVKGGGLAGRSEMEETSPRPHRRPQEGSVPDSKSRNIPEVVIVWRGAVGVLGIWKGWDSWVKGGANGVSLQAT